MTLYSTLGSAYTLIRQGFWLLLLFIVMGARPSRKSRLAGCSSELQGGARIAKGAFVVIR